MAKPWFDIREFDAGRLRADGRDDWEPVFRRAIAYLNSLGIADEPPGLPGREPRGNAGTLYVPTGIYRISRPVVIARRHDSEPRYLPCAVSIVGEATGNGRERGAAVRIVTSYLIDENRVNERAQLDRPALIVQGASTVRLRNLVIEGQNRWTEEGDDLRRQLLRHGQEGRGPDPYLVIGARDRGPSPYAGVCIDPFHPAVPQAGDQRYPDLSDQYLPGPASGDVLLEDCEVVGFTVGLCIAPAGLPLGAGDLSTVAMRGGALSVCKSDLSMGRYSRAQLTGVRLGPARIALNGEDYGGPGHCPDVRGGAAYAVRHVFFFPSPPPGGGRVHIDDLRVEGALSLGQLGNGDVGADAESTGYRISSCEVRFADPQLASPEPPLVSAHFICGAQVTMQGCGVHTPPSLVPSLPDPPVSFVNLGRLLLRDCLLGGEKTGGDPGAPFYVSGDVDRVRFDRCMVRDRWLGGPVGLAPISDRRQVSAFVQGPTMSAAAPQFLLGLLLPGTLTTLLRPTPGQRPAEAPPGPRFAQDPAGLVALGDYDARTLRLRPDGTGSFLCRPGVLQDGDLVVTLSAVSGVLLGGRGRDDAPLCVGQVLERASEFDPLTMELGERIRLGSVPLAVIDALPRLPPGARLPLSLWYLPRLHPPTKGRLIGGTREVRDVQVSGVPGTPAVSDFWAIGHRVRGEGVPEGAYVTAVRGSTLELSQVLPATRDTDLLDAAAPVMQTAALA